MKNTKLNHIVILLLTVLSTNFAMADQARWSVRSFPFGKSLDMSVVYQVTHAPLNQLVPLIKKYNVDIQIVKTDTDRDQKNPFLRGLPEAQASILPEIDFDELTDGMMISKDNACCKFKKDTIIIRDNASLYVLIHEFLHTQIRTEGRDSSRIGDLFLREHKTLNFRQQKIFQDSIRLVDSRWRRDLISSSKDYSALLYAKIQESQAEEAIIEKVLSQYIDAKSPYFEPRRTKEGLQYGERMINNAIDLYNYVTDVLRVNKGNVLRYREEIKKDILIPEKSDDLSEEQAQEFAKQTDEIVEMLKPTEVEILNLKKFYTE